MNTGMHQNLHDILQKCTIVLFIGLVLVDCQDTNIASVTCTENGCSGTLGVTAQVVHSNSIYATSEPVSITTNENSVSQTETTTGQYVPHSASYYEDSISVASAAVLYSVSSSSSSSSLLSSLLLSHQIASASQSTDVYPSASDTTIGAQQTKSFSESMQTYADSAFVTPSAKKTATYLFQSDVMPSSFSQNGESLANFQSATSGFISVEDSTLLHQRAASVKTFTDLNQALTSSSIETSYFSHFASSMTEMLSQEVTVATTDGVETSQIAQTMTYFAMSVESANAVISTSGVVDVSTKTSKDFSRTIDTGPINSVTDNVTATVVTVMPTSTSLTTQSNSVGGESNITTTTTAAVLSTSTTTQPQNQTNSSLETTTGFTIKITTELFMNRTASLTSEPKNVTLGSNESTTMVSILSTAATAQLQNLTTGSSTTTEISLQNTTAALTTESRNMTVGSDGSTTTVLPVTTQSSNGSSDTATNDMQTTTEGNSVVATSTQSLNITVNSITPTTLPSNTTVGNVTPTAGLILETTEGTRSTAMMLTTPGTANADNVTVVSNETSGLETTTGFNHETTKEIQNASSLLTETPNKIQNTTVASTAATTVGLQTTNGMQNTTVATTFGLATTNGMQYTSVAATTETTTASLETTSRMQNITIAATKEATTVGTETTTVTQNTTVAETPKATTIVLETTERMQNTTVAATTEVTTFGTETTNRMQNSTKAATSEATTDVSEITNGTQNITVAATTEATTIGKETTNRMQNSTVAATDGLEITNGTQNATVAATTGSLEIRNLTQNSTAAATTETTTVGLETTNRMLNTTVKTITETATFSIGTTNGIQNITLTSTTAESTVTQNTSGAAVTEATTDGLKTTTVTQNTTVAATTGGLKTTTLKQNTTVAATTEGLKTTTVTQNTTVAATTEATTVGLETTTVTQDTTVAATTEATTGGLKTTTVTQNTTVAATTEATTGGLKTTTVTQNTTVAATTEATTGGLKTTTVTQNTTVAATTEATTGGLKTTTVTQNTTVAATTEATTGGLKTTTVTQNTTVAATTEATTGGLKTTTVTQNTTVAATTEATTGGLKTTTVTQNTTVAATTEATTGGLKTTTVTQNTTVAATTEATTGGLKTTTVTQNTTVAATTEATTGGLKTTTVTQNTTVAATTEATTGGLKTTTVTQNTTVAATTEATTDGLETTTVTQNTTVAATTGVLETTSRIQNTTLMLTTPTQTQATSAVRNETTAAQFTAQAVATTTTALTTTTVSTTTVKSTTTTGLVLSTALVIEEVTLNTTEELKEYWVETVLSVPENINVSTYEFRNDMETKLSRLYFDAFKREEQINNGTFVSKARKKRAVMYEENNQNLTVQVIDISRGSEQPSNVDVVYYMEKDGYLVPAQSAVNVLNLYSEQELALQYFNYLVVSKAKVYDPPAVIVPDPPQYWIIGVVVGSIVGFVLIAWLILFIYFKCVKPPDPGKTPRTPRSRRRHSRQLHIGEPELMGVKKLHTADLTSVKTNGFTQIDKETASQRSEPPMVEPPPKRNYLERKPESRPPDIPPLDLNGIEQGPSEAVYANVSRPPRRPVPKKHRTPQKDDDDGLASDTLTHVSEESEVPRRRKPPKKPSRKRTPRRSQAAPTDSTFSQPSPEEPPVTYRSSHQLKLPPLTQKPLVGPSLYDQLQEQQKVEDTIRRKTDMEKQRNKQRLRKRKVPKDPYLRAQAEIDAVLAGSEQELLPESDRDRKHRRRKPPPKPKRRKAPYDHEEIELREGIPPSTSDAGYTETETELDQPESLDDTRKKIHRLLDDAFALISPKHGNKVAPHTATNGRPIPGSSLRRGRNQAVRSTQTTPKQSDRDDTSSEQPERLFELSPRLNTEEYKSGDAESLKPETVHTPMYIARHPQPKAYAGVMWSPYTVDDEAARVSPTKEPASIPPGGIDTSPIHSLKLGQTDQPSPELSVGQGHQSRSDRGYSDPAGKAWEPYNNRRALIPDDYTSLTFGTAQLAPSATRPRVQTPPHGRERTGATDSNNDSLIHNESNGEAFHPLRTTSKGAQPFSFDNQTLNSSTYISPASSMHSKNPILSHSMGGSRIQPNASVHASPPYRRSNSIGGPIEDGQDEIDVISSSLKPGSSAQPLIKSIREELLRLTQRRTPVKEFDS
ncbi:mucin-19 isoform X2 [Lingula anatina]|uniref:Mucin-19 isoform X2 n=1 Tax=Lingula anatina TaxID=7574 RepID=A0A1S3IJU2_LINAN|nr:mucin-19 isoform X2 [Lingula anatina]|eukprot:XP_013398482.1 mucin-19 isoform X2 [Lingula anatina]